MIRREMMRWIKTEDDQDDENIGGDLKRDGGTRMTVDEGIEDDGDGATDDNKRNDDRPVETKMNRDEAVMRVRDEDDGVGDDHDDAGRNGLAGDDRNLQRSMMVRRQKEVRGSMRKEEMRSIAGSRKEAGGERQSQVQVKLQETESQ